MSGQRGPGRRWPRRALLLFSAQPAQAWWKALSGTQSVSDPDQAHATTLDAAGDVVTAGELAGHFGVVKTSGTGGGELWGQELFGTGGIGLGAAEAVVVDGSGDVIAAGYLKNEGTGVDFTVIKFSGATGGELWRQEIDGTFTSPFFWHFRPGLCGLGGRHRGRDRGWSSR